MNFDKRLFRLKYKLQKVYSLERVKVEKPENPI